MSALLERVKLENPGDEKTITVLNVETEERGGYDYVSFQDEAVEISVPEKSITAQLDRVGASAVQDLRGKTIRFSRSEKVNKYGKPYWNLDLVAAKTTKPAYVQPQIASKPNSQLPPLLQNAEEEDNAELAAKIEADLEQSEDIERRKGRIQASMLQAVRFTLDKIEPLYTAKKIGLTGDEAFKHAFSIFQGWKDAGLVK